MFSARAQRTARGSETADVIVGRSSCMGSKAIGTIGGGRRHREKCERVLKEGRSAIELFQNTADIL